MKTLKQILFLAFLIAWAFSANSFAQTGEQAQVLALSRRVISALKQRNIKTLANYVHPSKGVRFSPYGYIHTDGEDLVFKKSEAAKLSNSRKIYDRGAYDAGENEIKMNFADYYKKFIYDKDFARAPQIAYNKIIKQGNTIVNIAEAYRDARFVEYHFAGTKKYGGMDWKSLRLIFEKSGAKWYLVGISHDQWTT